MDETTLRDSKRSDPKRSLEVYLSREVVSTKYEARHGRTANATKLRSITTHIEQGMELMAAAAAAPITTRPLMQYYGVAALGRATTLFCDSTAREASLKPAHGLHMVDWDRPGALHQDPGIGSVGVEVQNGLFTEFARSTKQAVTFRCGSSAPQLELSLGEIAVTTRFTLSDLLGLMPDLWPEYVVWRGCSPASTRVRGVKTHGDRATWSVETSLSEKECGTLFPRECVTAVRTGDRSVEIRTSDEAHFQPLQLHHGSHGLGDMLLVPPVGADVALSTASILHAVSYVMSMLARYRLTDWMRIWRGEKGDRIRPVVSRALNIIGTQYLRVCSDFFHGEPHEPPIR